MTEVFSIVFALPTLPFTVLLGLALLYWGLVIVGLSDIDVLDAADGDGLLDALGDAELDFGALAPGGAEAQLGEALAAVAIATDVGSRKEALAKLNTRIRKRAPESSVLKRVRSVPITISGSIFALMGWTISALYCAWFGGFETMLGALWVPIFGVVAVVATVLVLLPFLPILRSERAIRRVDSLAKIATVMTVEVNRKVGQGMIQDGGAGLLVQIRADPTCQLTKNDRALVVSYDATGEFYEVVRLDDLLSSA